MTFYLPNPCLAGIILTISTHNGPQMVFHYPPKLTDTDFSSDNELINQDSSSSDESDASDLENEQDEKKKNLRYVSGQTLLDLLDEQDKKKAEKKKKLRQSKKSSIASISEPVNSTSNNSLHLSDNTHYQNESLRKVFGFDPEFLAEIVNPPRQLCNSKFELTVDDMVFVGLPIHVNENGEWRKHKKRNNSKSRNSTNASSVKEAPSSSDSEDGDDEHSDPNDSTIIDGDSVNKNDETNTMNMFHVVFVMNPSIVEYNYRVDEMFHYVISRLALVLRYEQDKSNYIWTESKKILKIKEDNHQLPVFDLYSKLTTESSLAATLTQCFNSISTSEIATLEINEKLISLQIPLKNQFKSLLPKTTPVLPGSYISSTAIDNDSGSETGEDMGHMALLLLDDPEKIISDLKTESNSPLSIFIKSIHPMLSLNKLSTSNQWGIHQVTSFARHLIYWRRARAILPLHTKSVFIVSPMAPLKNIQKDSITFKKYYQSLPSLPSFLSLISNSKPRPYAAIIPSKDHRETYLDALGWLIRYGYVTQLLTFVWIKIQNRIKIAVEEDLEREGLTKKNKEKIKIFADLSTDNSSKDKDGTLNKKEDSSVNVTLDINGNEVTVIEEDEDDTIILDPERATAVERRWISKVIKGHPPDIVAAFHKTMKYFNGKTPIELVIVKENIQRQDLKRMLHGISENIISVKHW